MDFEYGGDTLDILEDPNAPVRPKKKVSFEETEEVTENEEVTEPNEKEHKKEAETGLKTKLIKYSILFAIVFLSLYYSDGMDLTNKLILGIVLFCILRWN